MLRPMELDSYWRTRTVRQAEAQGYAFLRLTCSCSRITDYPFPLLLQRRGVTRGSFLGNIPFRCKHRGGKEPGIGVHPRTNAAGYAER